MARRSTVHLILGLIFVPMPAALPGAESILPAPAAGPVEYWKDIHPILDGLCSRCHGGGNEKGDFRIDSRERILEGGRSGPAVLPGKSGESLLIDLVAAADPDRAMPRSGRRLTPDEIGLLRAWIDAGLPWADAAPTAARTAVRRRQADVRPQRPSPPPGPPDANPVDLFIDAGFREKGIEVPAPVDDGLFIRRACLDTIGLLPAPEEVDAFAADSRSGKRTALVRSLLARRREFAEHWLSFWNDLLRNDYQGTGYIDGGRRQITGWLYRALALNLPYDRMVAALIDPPEEASGFIRGITWRGVVNASQTPAMQAAQNVSQVFLGVNLKCASCHDSFVSDWKLKEAYGLASIFHEGPLEIARCDALTGETARPGFLWPELGAVDPALPREEQRRRIAGIVASRENGRLTRTIVNRLWAKLLGRGLVEPLDEMDGAAWHPDLLDWLAEDLAGHGFDLRWTLERILTSKAYALPADPRPEKAEGEFLFRGPEVRRLSAEQFLDAVGTITGAGNAFPEAPVDFACLGEAEDPPVPPPGIPDGAGWIGTGGEAPAGPLHCIRTVTLSDPPEAGTLVLAAGEFALAVNGKPVASGPGPGPVLVNILPHLRAGENRIALRARPAPGTAGVFVAAFLRGASWSIDIAGDASWKCGTAAPAGWESPAFSPAGWPDAAPARGLDGSSPAARALAAMLRVGADAGRYRAALARSSPLMTAMGRPNREQVVTRRPAVATTLEALELSNGATFAALLARGARKVLAGGPSPGELAGGLYRKALGRSPAQEERDAALSMIGVPPRPEGVEDLLWCILLSPEFQLIR